MEGVLEGAAVLCACKLACSLFFLPSLATSHSPISVCCCCLLIFTDFMVTEGSNQLLDDSPDLRHLHTIETKLLLTESQIVVESRPDDIRTSILSVVVAPAGDGNDSGMCSKDGRELSCAVSSTCSKDGLAPTNAVVRGHVFLSYMCIFESWLSELAPQGDVIALRFLLFLSHTYGMVLLLTTPLIAMETLDILLWPPTPRTVGQTAGSDGQPYCAEEVTLEEEEDEEEEEEEEESSDPDTDKAKGKHLSPAVRYLCCLSVWVVVALHVRGRSRLEEAWAITCLHTTKSLIRCLPNLFSHMPATVNPCWYMGFLSVLLLVLVTGTGLHRQHRATAQMARRHKDNHGVTKSVNPGMAVSACRVYPDKTESGCTIHSSTYSWKSVQKSAACPQGELVLFPPECLSTGRGLGQELERTKKGIPLTFITVEDHMDSQYRSQSGWRQWAFPCLGVNVMIGLVGVLLLLVLPLNLSVNILLFRTIESLLEQCIKTLALPTPHISNAATTSPDETLV